MLFILVVLFAAEFGCGGKSGGDDIVFLSTGTGTGTGTGGTIPG